MLRIEESSPSAATLATLKTVQARIDEKTDYPARVIAAGKEWDAKAGSVDKREAIRDVRLTLSKMCVGSVRCAYCEDSLADEIEHIEPKSLFPQRAFDWTNYLFACGPCNGPKSNRYGTMCGTIVQEFVRKKGDPVVPPPASKSAFIDPRSEDPFDFFEIDIGGVTPNGQEIFGTFTLMSRAGISDADLARSEFTIEVLGLNREVIRAARENAFGGFRARMREYVARKNNGATADELSRLCRDLLKTPHLSVFEDMRRQRKFQPELAQLFAQAPEMLSWEVVPPAK